jgi:REP element-mobilizing transposase RayT
MQRYCKMPHTSNNCKYHIRMKTKYPKKFLGGLLGKIVRKLLRWKDMQGT